MSQNFDVAVIGASVSGASLAIQLGQAGLRVALIDRDEFPRRKACGEGVSEIALEALGRLGLSDELAALQGRPFYSYRIDLGKRSVGFSSSRRRLKGMGVQRYELDLLLSAHAAKQPTVATFFGNAVTGLREETGGHLVSLSSGGVLWTRRVVLADGATSHNAAKLGVPKTMTKSPLWGMSFVLEGEFEKTTGEVLVLLKDGFEVNCTPVSGTRLNISFLVEKAMVPKLQDPEVRERLLDEAKAKSFFRGDPIGKPLQVGPVGATRRPYFHGSVLLVGDAAESLDPIAGMGMTHGVLMAELAARSLVAHLRDGVSLEATLKDYARDAEQMTRPYRGFTHLTASLLRSRARGVLVPTLAFAKLPEVIRGSLDGRAIRESVLSMLPNFLLCLAGA